MSGYIDIVLTKKSVLYKGVHSNDRRRQRIQRKRGQISKKFSTDEATSNMTDCKGSDRATASRREPRLTPRSCSIDYDCTSVRYETDMIDV